MKIVVIGASGALGSAFVEFFSQKIAGAENNTVYAFARSQCQFQQKNVICNAIDITDQDSVKEAAKTMEDKTIDLIIIATGVLHCKEHMPERSIAEIDPDYFSHIMAVNTLGPMLVAKHFSSKLHDKHRSIIAFLSARVGSISDNNLGGWYTYRASKAALNMIIKGLSIELKRLNKQAIAVGLHPGTVVSQLSEPFLKNNINQSVRAEEAVSFLVKVIKGLKLEDSGKLWAWDGKEISA